MRALGNGLSQGFEYYAWDEKAMVDDVLTGQGGRLKTLSTGTLQNLSYLYDATGNIRQISDSLTSEIQAFGYDEVNRLRSADATGGPAPYGEGYTYDPTTGNLQSKGGPSDTYAYQATATSCRVLGPDGNLITGTRSVAHAVSGYKGNTYGYDCNGNMITRTIMSGPLVGSYSLGYDAENRLITVTGPNSFTASFVYNGDGQRVQSTINGLSTTFVGNYYEVAGGTATKYYFAGSVRIAMRTATSLYYLLGDHLGSTSIATDASGNKISELRYSAWGETRYASGATPTTYRYTGQREDSYIKLLDYGSRHYDPELGRFISPDSIVPTPTQGVQAWDRYAYVNNSPINFVDPTGHSVDCGLGEQYCGAGKLDVKRRALDYANHMRYRARHGTVWTWEGLNTVRGDSVLSEGGWTEGDYYDHILGGVSAADPLHDPATYIVGAVGVGGLWKAGYSAIVLVGSQLATQNPDGRMVSIGSYDPNGTRGYIEVAEANGYTYFDLGRYYGILKTLRLAQPINNQFVTSQISQGKDFAVTVINKIGSGTAAEIDIIKANGAYIQSAFTSFSQFWSCSTWQ